MVCKPICVSFTLMNLKDLKKVKIQKVSLFEVGNGNILLLNYIFFYFGGGGVEEMRFK